MRKIISLLILSTLLISTARAQTPPAASGQRQLVFLLSRMAQNTDRDAALTNVLTFILGGTQLGDSLDFYDGDTLEPILDEPINIPQDHVYDNIHIKEHQFAKQIDALRNWFQDDGVNQLGFFNAPDFLREFSRKHRDPNRALWIILLGSPLYNNPQAPAWSMLKGYPNDICLSADQYTSPYSTRNYENGLENQTTKLEKASVVWIFMNRPHYLTNLHGIEVERFWSQFIDKLGGNLVSFCSSNDIQHEVQNPSTPLPVENDPNDSSPTKPCLLAPPDWGLSQTSPSPIHPPIQSPTNVVASIVPPSPLPDQLPGPGLSKKEFAINEPVRLSIDGAFLHQYDVTVSISWENDSPFELLSSPEAEHRYLSLGKKDITLQFNFKNKEKMEKKVSVEVNSVILTAGLAFERGSADLSADGEQKLNEFASTVRELNLNVRVQGFTDNKPILGPLAQRYPDNESLSIARAKSVADFLVDQLHVDKSKVIYEGLGASKFIATNETEEGRSQNRRVEIIMTSPK